MFSGIIETTAVVLAARTKEGMRTLRIKLPRGWQFKMGASVSVDGICSTVVKEGRGYFEVEYMPQTIAKTTAALFKAGSLVNLERSLKYGQRIDGHPVQGHVDCAT